jgi:hypothetical protein
LVSKPRKILGTEEYGPLYSLVNRQIYVAVHSSVNRGMYGGPSMNIKFSYRRTYSLPAPAPHSATLDELKFSSLTLNRRRLVPCATATPCPSPMNSVNTHMTQYHIVEELPLSELSIFQWKGKGVGAPSAHYVMDDE